MTPQERAEEIWHEIHQQDFLTPDGVEFIAAQIEEAEREAVKYKADPDCEEHCRLAKLEGFAAGFTNAREKAKGIAEDVLCEHLCWEKIADRIAKMEPEK